MDNTQRPKFIYGTAWKGPATTTLVQLAITQGFRAIDTANQPKHYSESLVGDAIAAVVQSGMQRDQLFLQTKFTPIDSQDKRVPYDINADISTQVQQSFQSSLTHLQTNYVDSYLLHGPYSWPRLCDEDYEAWQAIEKIYESGQAKLIGVSNFNVQQLELLTQAAKIKPMVVQNRCFADQAWDKNVREFCKSNNIMHQGFSLLTANMPIMQHPVIQEIADRLSKTPAQIIFRFAIQIGMVPLTGTTNEKHMQQDLQVDDFELTIIEQTKIETLNL